MPNGSSAIRAGPSRSALELRSTGASCPSVLFLTVAPHGLGATGYRESKAKDVKQPLQSSVVVGGSP